MRRLGRFPATRWLVNGAAALRLRRVVGIQIRCAISDLQSEELFDMVPSQADSQPRAGWCGPGPGTHGGDQPPTKRKAYAGLRRGSTGCGGQRIEPVNYGGRYVRPIYKRLRTAAVFRVQTRDAPERNARTLARHQGHHSAARGPVGVRLGLKSRQPRVVIRGFLEVRPILPSSLVTFASESCAPCSNSTSTPR